MMTRIKPKVKARVGLYSTGHPLYWEQFDGLKDRLLGYGKFIEGRMASSCHVYNFGMVDTVDSGRRAGEYFSSKNVDIVFMHSATYELSSAVLSVHLACQAPVIILNLQPCEKINYQATSTQEWLSQDTACAIPEFCNVFRRAGVPFHIVSGMLGMEKDLVDSVTDCDTAGKEEALRAWTEIGEYIDAAMVVRNLRQSNFGFLGNFYGGMLDMYTDLTMLQATFGTHVEILEMSDLERHFQRVTPEEIRSKIKEIHNFFKTDGDSPADAHVTAPSDERIEWSAKVACAQESMARKHNLDALGYYYHGFKDHFEDLQSGFIVGHSLLTAAGIPCAGEGDIKTALAMKVCELLGKGGSFCEIVTTDYSKNAVVIGHDGPFHIDITSSTPIMREMAIYHGKRGAGISVEASVRPGNVTTFGVAQKEQGAFHFLASEGRAYPSDKMSIGNTETHVDFGMQPDAFYEKWFHAAPTHHFALSIDHNISVLAKVADILGIALTAI